MFKALVTDIDTPFDEDIHNIFSNRVAIKVAEKIDEEYLAEQVKDCDAVCSVFVNAKISEKVIQSGKKLKVIARFGVGVDNINVSAATKRGILVTNCPEYHLPSMPEHVIALLFALARNIPHADKHVRQGKWDHKEVMGIDIEGKTLGIVGFGRIGTILSRKAIGLGMNVITCDPYLTAVQAKSARVTKGELMEVMQKADFLSVNVPLNENTRGLINKDNIKQMKSSAYLINTARGPVVDEDALYDSLMNKQIAGAAMDVMAHEPPAKDHRFFALDNVIITPHCGGSTIEAFQRVGKTAAQSVIDVLEGKKAAFICNPDALKSASH